MTPPSSWEDPQQRPQPPTPPPARGAPTPPPPYPGRPYQQYPPSPSPQPHYQPPPPQPSRPSGSHHVNPTRKQIAAAVLGTLALIFILQNTETTGVRLIIPKVHFPLFIALFLAALLGAGVTFLLMWRRQRDQERKTGGPPPR